MEKRFLLPDYLFEVSWEVCNKIGGIHTVLSTKAKSLREDLNDRHILIGPDVWRESEENPEFEEDINIYTDWQIKVFGEGLRVKVGRWKINGSPVAILIDFTTFIPKKDEILSKLWESYKLDSISGQWDYIEPTLFGYATGCVIESFIRFNLNSRTRVVAHFHEWMSGAGILYLKEHVPQVANVFTTHATVIGRAIAGNLLPLYGQLDNYDGDAKSNDFNVVSKQSIEKLSAQNVDCFTTVSEITARECSQFLKKDVDLVTPNGFDDSFVPKGKELIKKREEAKTLLIKVSETLIGYKLPVDPLIIASSGRYEFRNKGLDVFIDALGELNKKELTKEVLAFILIPADHYGPRKDLLEALNSGKFLENNASCLTHNLHNPEYDLILNRLTKQGLNNEKSDKVKVIFVPSYLNGNDGLFNKNYYDILIGIDLTVFASYYEPWGYTPLESLAFGVPTITSSLTGFSLWIRKNNQKPSTALTIVDRDDSNYNETVAGITDAIYKFSNFTAEETKNARNSAFELSRISLWENLLNITGLLMILPCTLQLTEPICSLIQPDRNLLQIR